MIYEFKITLDHVKPKVWRRVLVPGDVYLDELHAIFQLAMAGSPPCSATHQAEVV